MPTEESSFPVLDDIDITLNGIKKLLKDLNPNKSPGPDNIGPRVLKELAEDIAPLLLMIYRKSLDTGEVPEDWRTANVTPAFKKGQKYQAENYRPISLTSVCCKIVEHVITSQIMNHGENNNILYPLQHGFRRGRSCETQLIEFIDDLSSNLQKNQQTDVIIMDFAKALVKFVRASWYINYITMAFGVKSINGSRTGSPTGNNVWLSREKSHSLSLCFRESLKARCFDHASSSTT